MHTSLNDSVRLTAANSILNRALGKPRQAVEARLNYDLRQLSDAQLIEIIVDAGGVPPGLPAPAPAEKIVD